MGRKTAMKRKIIFLFGICLLVLSCIKMAVEKDNGHYFEEAVEFYNLGIDNLMYYMKTENNSNTRFQLAKKVDVYVKRVVYLKNVLENRELINEIQNAPLAPIVK